MHEYRYTYTCMDLCGFFVYSIYCFKCCVMTQLKMTTYALDVREDNKYMLKSNNAMSMKQKD